MIFQEILTAIPTEEVQEKTFFMEALTAPYIIWELELSVLYAYICSHNLYKIEAEEGRVKDAFF